MFNDRGELFDKDGDLGGSTLPPKELLAALTARPQEPSRFQTLVCLPGGAYRVSCEHPEDWQVQEVPPCFDHSRELICFYHSPVWNATFSIDAWRDGKMEYLLEWATLETSGLIQQDEVMLIVSSEPGAPYVEFSFDGWMPDGSPVLRHWFGVRCAESWIVAEISLFDEEARESVFNSRYRPYLQSLTVERSRVCTPPSES